MGTYGLRCSHLPGLGKKKTVLVRKKWCIASPGALHTRRLLESLDCEIRPRVPLHRRCLPGCGPETSSNRDIETCFLHRLQPQVACPPPLPPLSTPSLLPSGGGSPSFSKSDTSVRIVMGSRTLLSMKQFIEDAEKECADDSPELEVKDLRDTKTKSARQEGIRALKKLFEDFEAQLRWQEEVNQEEGSLNDSQEDAPLEPLDQPTEPLTGFSSILSLQEYEEALNPKRGPQLYLCDDWIRPVEVMLKPGELSPRDKVRTRVAKNFLLVTLMSLNTGYGALLERYQREGGDTELPTLNSVTLTEEGVRGHSDELDQRVVSTMDTPAGMPPSTVLARHLTEVSIKNSAVAVVKDANLKMYHVMQSSNPSERISLSTLISLVVGQLIGQGRHFSMSLCSLSH